MLICLVCFDHMSPVPGAGAVSMLSLLCFAMPMFLEYRINYIFTIYLGHFGYQQFGNKMGSSVRVKENAGIRANGY